MSNEASAKILGHALELACGKLAEKGICALSENEVKICPQCDVSKEDRDCAECWAIICIVRASATIEARNDK